MNKENGKMHYYNSAEQNSGESNYKYSEKPLEKHRWSVYRIGRIGYWIVKIVVILYEIYKHSN